MHQDGSIQKKFSIPGDTYLLAHAIILSPNGEDQSLVNVESLEKEPNHHCYYQNIKLNAQSHDKTLSRTERSLAGKIVSPCHILTDLYGNIGAYFIFEDLSVNIEGTYKLKICVTDLSVSKELCRIESERFTCFPPGVLLDRDGNDHYTKSIESTEISKHFAEQGVKIPLKFKR